MKKVRPDMNAEGAELGTVPAEAGFSLKRVWPLLALALAIVAVFALDLDRYLTFAALREHREALTALVEGNVLLAALAFVVVYALAVALSVPGGAILTDRRRLHVRQHFRHGFGADRGDPRRDAACS